MDKTKFFKMVMEKSNSDKVILMTNHYQITGTVYECDVCNKEEFVNLTDASLCKFEESYMGSCDDFSKNKYDWLHVNLDKVVAFSFV